MNQHTSQKVFYRISRAKLSEFFADTREVLREEIEDKQEADLTCDYLQETFLSDFAMIEKKGTKESG